MAIGSVTELSDLGVRRTATETVENCLEGSRYDFKARLSYFL